VFVAFLRGFGAEVVLNPAIWLGTRDAWRLDLGGRLMQVQYMYICSKSQEGAVMLRNLKLGT
jgi:hypothetical protein